MILWDPSWLSCKSLRSINKHTFVITGNIVGDTETEQIVACGSYVTDRLLVLPASHPWASLVSTCREHESRWEQRGRTFTLDHLDRELPKIKPSSPCKLPDHSLGKELVWLHDDPINLKCCHSGWPWCNAFLKVSEGEFKPHSEMEVVLRKSAWIVGFHLGQWWFWEKVNPKEAPFFCFSSILLLSWDLVTWKRMPPGRGWARREGVWVRL